MLKKRLKPLLWVNCNNEKTMIIDTYKNLLPELRKLLLTDGIDITIGFSHPSENWLNVVMILSKDDIDYPMSDDYTALPEGLFEAYVEVVQFAECWYSSSRYAKETTILL